MKVAVFCGSKAGAKPEFTEATRELAAYLASKGVELVYGGGNVGLMGVVANGFLENGGKVYGVIPEYLHDKEIAHKGLTELHIVPDMHVRKATMADMADAFIALPGGAGTFEEIFEAWTWAQLGLHHKPCAFFNVAGFYDPLKQMISSMAEQGFMKADYANMLIHTDNAATLLAEIEAYQAPQEKWV